MYQLLYLSTARDKLAERAQPQASHHVATLLRSYVENTAIR